MNEWTSSGEELSYIDSEPCWPKVGDSVPNIILFVSCLEINSADPEGAMRAQLLADFIAGGIGSQEDRELSVNIVKVIVVGNSIAQSEVHTKDAGRFSSRQGNVSTENIKQLDTILCQFLSVSPVDLIPGPSDPVNFLLPQQV